MAYCDVCENFDWEHIDGDPEIVANMTDEGKKNFQPDLYYYWDGDFCSEDYYWRDAFPDVDCMCEVCFDIANFSNCLLYTSPSPRDATLSRMPSSA